MKWSEVSYYNIILFVYHISINFAKNLASKYRKKYAAFISIAQIKTHILKSKLALIVALLIINFSAVENSRAADTMDTIITVLTNMTCETQGVGDLLRSEFSHTCIPASFFTFAISNIISPGLYANAVLKLKINSEQLFPGACKRENRIDPGNLVLNFAVCSNLKLIVVRAEAVVKAAIAIAASFLTGSDPWGAIAEAWIPPEGRYHEMFTGHVGDSGIVFDLGIIPILPWQVIRDNDRLCVATLAFTGWIPVGCKYIKEPHPKSIYASFIDLNASDDTPPPDSSMTLTSCTSTGGCYQRAYNASRASIVITAPIIECLKQMIAQLLISTEVCSIDDVEKVVNSASRKSSSLYQFQSNMYKIVALLLTIYVVLFGFNVLLSGNPPPKAEIINFIIKIIFVVYFSIGINIEPYTTGGGRLDGMSQWAFPLLINGMQEFASWIMNASPSDLCRFDGSGDTYPEGLGYISLWDSLDCRVAHYLGLDMIQTLIVENQARNHDFAHFDFFNFSIPPYYYLLPPAIITGNTTLISLVLMYPLLVISVAAYLVNATVVCMIGIVIIGILAPLFVPMLLFEYTKGYFESWVKLLLSFMLQPMVTVTFMIVMFSVYDFGFYGSCKYTSANMKSNGRNAKIFFIDNNWNDGAYQDGEVKGCQNSLGYILNNPIQSMYNMAASTVEAASTQPKSATNSDFMSKFPVLGAITSDPGLFFTMPKLIFQKIEDLVLALITACFTLYLMYHFSAQLSDFAADMTEGVSLNGVAIGAQDVFKAGMAAIQGAGGAGGGGGKGGGGAGKGGSRSAGDKHSQPSGDGGAEDKSSTEDEDQDEDEAEDKSIAANVSSSASDKLSIPSHENSNQEGQTTTAQENGVGLKENLSTTKPAQLKPVEYQPIITKASTIKNEPIKTEVTKDEPIKKEVIKDKIIKDEVLKKEPQTKMQRMEISEAKAHLAEAFDKVKVDSTNLRGLEYDTARNMAFLSDEKESKFAKDNYKKEIKNILENKLMKGKEKEFTDILSDKFSGDRKVEIDKIHKEIFDELNTNNKKFGSNKNGGKDA